MTFLREHPDERVLVHVARAGHPPVSLPLRALGVSGDVEVLHGASALVSGAELLLPSDGPAAAAYLLR
jgi:alpha-glucosidase